MYDKNKYYKNLADNSAKQKYKVSFWKDLVIDMKTFVEDEGDNKI